MVKEQPDLKYLNPKILYKNCNYNNEPKKYQDNPNTSLVIDVKIPMRQINAVQVLCGLFVFLFGFVFTLIVILEPTCKLYDGTGQP